MRFFKTTLIFCLIFSLGSARATTFSEAVKAEGKSELQVSGQERSCVDGSEIDIFAKVMVYVFENREHVKKTATGKQKEELKRIARTARKDIALFYLGAFGQMTFSALILLSIKQIKENVVNMFFKKTFGKVFKKIFGLWAVKAAFKLMISRVPVSVLIFLFIVLYPAETGEHVTPDKLGIYLEEILRNKDDKSAIERNDEHKWNSFFDLSSEEQLKFLTEMCVDLKKTEESDRCFEIRNAAMEYDEALKKAVNYDDEYSADE